MRSSSRAFTLIELLVVVAVIVVLVGILVPSLAIARSSGRKAACLSNLHQIGTAIFAYAADRTSAIPYGPKAPPMMTAVDFYPLTGAPTSLISLLNGAPVGLGLLLAEQLSRQPRSLFCPGADQPIDADAELANVGKGQAQSSYYYRHGSIVTAPPPGGSAIRPRIRLEDLGNNRNDLPIRALVIDTQFLVPPTFASFNVLPRTHHEQKFANVLYADGAAVSLVNTDSKYTFNLDTYPELMNAFDYILQTLEKADAEK